MPGREIQMHKTAARWLLQTAVNLEMASRDANCRTLQGCTQTLETDIVCRIQKGNKTKNYRDNLKTANQFIST